MPFFFRIFLILCLPLLAQSQTLNCGTNLDYFNDSDLRSIRQWYQKVNTSELRANERDTIPVTVHQIRSPENKPNLRYEDIVNMIALANQEFDPMGIHFSLCGSPRYFDGRSEYTFNEAEGLNYDQHLTNTLNIYLVDGITAPNGNRLCGLSKFPFQSAPDERYVLLAKDCALTGVTLIHELGHFFGLLHTHENQFGYELVNGNNCHNAGDLICDTPADPNLIIPNSVFNCGYIGNRVDYNGDRYQPSVKNFMSNAPFECQQTFSREQKQFMLAIAREEFSYLTNSACHIEGDLSIQGQLTSSSVNDVGQILGSFLIQNKDFPALEAIELRVSLFNSPGRRQGILLHQENLSFQKDETAKTIELPLDIPSSLISGTYYLVATIDARFEITETTEANNRFIQSIEIDNSHLADLSLFPNPAEESISLFLRSPQTSGRYTIKVFSPTGAQLIQTQGLQSGPEILHQLNVSQLSEGIYLAHIEFENKGIQRSLRFFKK